MNGENEFRIRVEEGGERLDRFLAAAMGESRSFIALQIEQGNVILNGKVAKKSSLKVREGDELEVRVTELPVLDVEAIEGPLHILYEDSDILVLNKAQGIVVHPAPGTREPTLVHFLLHHLRNQPDFAQMSETRPGIVHRLDRGTSGVMIVAKTRKAKENLGGQFKERSLKKQYEAIVWGEIAEQGSFSDPLGRHPVDRKRMSSQAKEGREAFTEFRRAESLGDFSLVNLYPKTGRTHQLRVHLSEAGYPIVGDPVYGSRLIARRMGELSRRWYAELEKFKETALHAKSLRFRHPGDNREMYWEAPRPESFERLLNLLRERNSE